jgi:hypothetical protein
MIWARFIDIEHLRTLAQRDLAIVCCERMAHAMQLDEEARAAAKAAEAETSNAGDGPSNLAFWVCNLHVRFVADFPEDARRLTANASRLVTRTVVSTMGRMGRRNSVLNTPDLFQLGSGA